MQSGGAPGIDSRVFLVAGAAAAVVVAAVGGLAMVLGGTDHGDVPPAPTATSTTTSAEAVAPSPTTSEPVAPDQAGIPDGAGGRLPPMGIPTTAFTWQVGGLPGTELWVSQVVDVGDELWAVGGRYREAAGEVAMVWAPDGAGWTAVDLPAAFSQGGSLTIYPTETVIVATVDQWDESTVTPDLRLFVSTDGAQWAESDLAALSDPGEHVWISGVAGGEGTLVLVGTRDELLHESKPAVVTFEHDGKLVEVDDVAGTYHVHDAATSELLAYGSLDLLWGGGGSLAISDPVTGETIFSGDYAELARVATVAYESAVPGARLVVELAGPQGMLALDEYAGEVTVTDHEGVVRFTGRTDDLWRGPTPSFVDPHTGDVVVTVPWEIWEAARAGGVAAEESLAEPVLAVSQDGGRTWREVDVAVGPGFQFGGVAHGPRGFLAVGGRELPRRDGHPGAPEPVVLHSLDGVAWAELASDLGPGWPYSLASTPDGYVAMLGHDAGVDVVSSPDGRSWADELRTSDLQLPIGSAWFDHLATGPLGTFVTGGRDGWGPAAPGTSSIGEHGRTLTIAPPVYTLTDDATGAVIATFDERAGGETAAAFRWGEGGLAVFAGDGTVLFAISHPEFEAAMEDVWAEPQQLAYPPEPFVVLLGDDGPTSVALPDAVGPDAWCSGIAVTDDALVLVTMKEGHGTAGVSSLRVQVLIGTPG